MVLSTKLPSCLMIMFCETVFFSAMLSMAINPGMNHMNHRVNHQRSMIINDDRTGQNGLKSAFFSQIRWFAGTLCAEVTSTYDCAKVTGSTSFRPTMKKNRSTRPETGANSWLRAKNSVT